MASIALLVGDEAAAKISMDFGGTRIYIPQRPGEHAPLSVCVGLDAANKIAQTYGGMEFTVPLMLGKKSEIILLNQDGLSASQIARKVRCSISMVYRIRAELEADKQTSLPL